MTKKTLLLLSTVFALNSQAAWGMEDKDDQSHNSSKQQQKQQSPQVEVLFESSSEELENMAKKLDLIEKILSFRNKIKLGELKVKDEENNVIQNQEKRKIENSNMQEKYEQDKKFNEIERSTKLIGETAQIITHYDRDMAEIKGLELKNIKLEHELASLEKSQNRTIGGYLKELVWSPTEIPIIKERTNKINISKDENRKLLVDGLNSTANNNKEKHSYSKKEEK